MQRLAAPRSRRLARLAVLGLLAAAGAASHAQMGGGGMGGGMGGMRRGGGGGESMRRDTDTRKDEGPSLADRLYELRVRLLVEPDQAAAWERFYADAQALARRQPRAVSVSEEGSALQSMQRELTLAQNRYALVENLTGSLQALYAQLRPAQREAADQLVPRLLPFVLQPERGAGTGQPPQGR